MLYQENYILEEDIQKLFKLFNRYDISVPLKYAVMLSDINNIITESEKAIRDIPDDASTYESEIHEETVKVYEPCPPSEFCDSPNSNRFLSLFNDIVGDDIRDTLDQMENGEYWENCNCSKDIKDTIKEYLESIKYDNSYGICNYYNIEFKLPPISDFADYDSEDEVIDAVADIAILYDLINAVQFAVKGYTVIDELESMPTPYEAEKKLHLILDKSKLNENDKIAIKYIDIGLGVKNINTTEEYIDDLLDRISSLLWEKLDKLEKIKNIAEEASRKYETIFKAIDFVCEEFSRWANSVEDFYEKLENWREFFEANEMDDVLEELFGVESQMESQAV
jgi:hypothetical protein